MSEISKTYIKTLQRHQRIIILVKPEITEKKLVAMFCANQHVWGGRYNPIIPFIENSIPESWHQVIMGYDPDYIYYPKGEEIVNIHSLKFLHPVEFIPYYEGDNSFHVPGINIHNLLHEYVGGMFGAAKLSLLEYGNNCDLEFPSKEFYDLNLGFKKLYAGESKWLSRFNKVMINEENVRDLNKMSFENKIFAKSILSQLHISSTIFETNFDKNIDRFEWVLYDSNIYFSDLLYFWNRQLYIRSDNRLHQVLCSVTQLQELLKDDYFIALVIHVCYFESITLVSTTLSGGILSALCNEVQQRINNKRVSCESIESFPYPVTNRKLVQAKQIPPQNHLILGKSDYLRLPHLLFENNNPVTEGVYATDTSISRDTESRPNEVKFPFDTSLFHLLTKSKARINQFHRVTLITDCSGSGVEFNIPTDIELVRHVLHNRDISGKSLALPLELKSLSNSGQKLYAFFKLFDKNWDIISEFIEESFWVNLFKHDSEVNQSPIKLGKGIFSFQDLEKEIDLLYEKYKNDIGESIRMRGEGDFTDDTIDHMIERDKKESFRFFINSNLDYLIHRRGLLMGMKVSCIYCGSNKWYSLKELNDKINCKGCNSSIMPDLQSKIYYKLSEILINNLLSDQIKNSKNYDGNFIVLKTLLYLKNSYHSRTNSFIWSPPINFCTRKANEKPFSSDLDILAIVDGELIIGEAKSDSGQFNNKEIGQLIWIANNLYPDKIILACEKGNLNEKVEKVKAGITNPNCDVIAYNISRPWYHLPGLFGFPNENDGN